VDVTDESEIDTTTVVLPGWRGRPITVDRPLLPWQRVEVSGPSMSPTLRSGDVVLVRHGAGIRPGDVVLARFRSLPDRLVLKRTVRAEGDGWWLASDNPFAGGDSAVHGVADVLARVTWRVRPGRPRRVH
jgi:phage repressor protein C with HTH and peptisase S24 domain